MTSINDRDSLINHLIHNLLRTFPLVHDRRRLAHQERTGVLHLLVCELVALGVEVVFDGDDTLAGQLFDLGLSVVFPVVDIFVHANAEGAAGEDDGADVVVEAGGLDGVLVGFRGAGFFGEDEAGADPDGGGAESEGCGERLTVEEAAGGDHLDRFAGHGGGFSFDEFGDGGNEDGCWDIAGVAAAL